MTKKAFISWGGWDGHQPDLTAKIMRELLESEGYEVVVEHSLEPYTDEGFMSDLNLVVPNWTMSQINPAQEKGLLSAIRAGCGCVGWHGGMGDSFRNNVEYQFMVGGQFICHPGGVIDYQVDPCETDDPVMAGIKPFQMHSEQYFMHVDPANEVLATTTFSGDYWKIDWVKDVVMPVVWKKRYGKGNVFYSSLGHQAVDFEVPEVLEIIRRGALWAST